MTLANLMKSLVVVTSAALIGCGAGELEGSYVGCETAPNDGRDSDGDGVPDSIERGCWEIWVDTTGTGEAMVQTVGSDPQVVDTDGDGLDDGVEHSLRTNPRLADTDGDGITDYDEVQVYSSDPRLIDTDGDSRGALGDQLPSSRLFDGAELTLTGTSPTLADTDGDGITDYDEILGGGFNPLRADLPQLSLELDGDPNIRLNASYTEGTSERSETFSAQLQRQSSEMSKTDTTSTQTSIENTQTVSSSVEASGWPPSAKVKVSASAEFKQGYVNETSSSWTESSAQESEQQFNETQELEASREVSYSDGTLTVAMKLRNESDVSFRLNELSLIVYRMTPNSPAGYTVVTTLDADLGEEGQVLGPRRDVKFVASNADVNPDDILALMANPSGLFFQVAGYQLYQTDEVGNETKNYDVLGQKVIERTGLVVIDYGDGRVERHMVATNVHRNAGGDSAGVALSDVMENILRIDYATEARADSGIMALTRVKDREARIFDVANPAARGFWFVAGSGPEFDAGAAVDFEDIRLRNGQRISLVYVSDTDGDGVFDREEYLQRTDELAADSDGDDLSDYDELKAGWTVTLVGGEPVTVFSDPLDIDADGDGLTDAEERALGLDPMAADTDGDGAIDPHDEFPLDAARIGVAPDVALSGGTVRNVSIDGVGRRAYVAPGESIVLEFDYDRSHPGEEYGAIVGIGNTPYGCPLLTDEGDTWAGYKTIVAPSVPGVYTIRLASNYNPYCGWSGGATMDSLYGVAIGTIVVTDAVAAPMAYK